MDFEHEHFLVIQEPNGGHLNKMTPSYQYRYPHYKIRRSHEDGVGVGSTNAHNRTYLDIFTYQNLTHPTHCV